MSVQPSNPSNPASPYSDEAAALRDELATLVSRSLLERGEMSRIGDRIKTLAERFSKLCPANEKERQARGENGDSIVSVMKDLFRQTVEKTRLMTSVQDVAQQWEALAACLDATIQDATYPNLEPLLALRERAQLNQDFHRKAKNPGLLNALLASSAGVTNVL